MSDYTNAPNIDTLIVTLLTDDLGSHVEWRAEDLLQSTLLTIETSEAEVSQFQIELAWLRCLFRGK